MLDKIKASIKAKFPDVNLSKKRLDEIADRLSKKITDESEIDAKLDEFNELMPLAEIAKTDDKLRDLSNKAKDKPAPVDAPPKDDNPEPPKDQTAEMLKVLLEKVTKLENEKVQSTIQQQLAAKLQGVPASFYKGRIPQSIEQLDSAAEEILSDFTAMKQELINSGLSESKPPIGGNPGAKGTPTTKEIDAILDSI